MPELKCTVQTCMHNKQYNCELDSINVEGNTAKRTSETSCGSFKEKKGNDNYSNAVGKATDQASVDCKAIDCTYNDACKCHAGKISVEGGNACVCGETECASFTCSCN